MSRQLDVHVKTAFDAIVAHTPEPGPTPTSDVLSLTLGNTARSTHRAWLAVAAASIVAVGVGAVASLSSSPSQPAPFGTPSPTANGVSDTTITYPTGDLVPVGAVVCLDAGAGQIVTDLCVEELAVDSFAASKTITDSFVMPIDPANAGDQASAVAIAGVLGLPVGPFDATFIPAGIALREEATVFLVLGTSRDPYASIPFTPLPAGAVLNGVVPECTTSDEIEYRCSIDAFPEDVTALDYTGYTSHIVDDTSHISGGCRSISSDATQYICYVGQRAVDEGTIAADLLGSWAPREYAAG